MYRVLEVDGDLHVRGDLSTFARRLVGLVVHGDLIVDGTFADNDDPRTFTLVEGELRARSIVTSGELEVHGRVTCEHLLGDYNDYGARFDGGLTAALFFPEHHGFRISGPVNVGLCIGDGRPHVERAQANRVLAAAPPALRAALHPELLRGVEDDELEVDRRALVARVRAGRSIWRAAAPTPAPHGTTARAPEPTATAKAATKRPAPTATAKRPAPTATAKRPEPTATAKRPEPTATAKAATKRPKPTATAKRPEPVPDNRTPARRKRR